MDKLSVFEAKARFSEVVSRAESGKQTVITKRGKPVARVIPEKPARIERWDRPLVVDASVVVAWFVRDQASAYTDRVRRQARHQRLPVPAIWPLEFSNARWQLQRRKLISASQVDTIVKLAELLDIEVHRETHTPRHRLALAREHKLTSYDASYLDPALGLRYWLPAATAL